MADKEDEELPAYLRDEVPKGKTDYTKYWLLHGKSEEELVQEGCNPGTVRIAAFDLEKEGLRKRPSKSEGSSAVRALPSVSKGVQIFAKGSPPEALIESMKVPVEDGQLEGFETGMKFGASMIVLGVRIAQELSSMGITQARPLVEMARDMRSGEAAAARSSAMEAAAMAAAQVQQNIVPLLAGMSKQPEGGDPMRAMMARIFEPMLKGVMGQFLPGGGGDALPEGWVKKSV